LNENQEENEVIDINHRRDWKLELELKREMKYEIENSLTDFLVSCRADML
jgi:hypothetical protein